MQNKLTGQEHDSYLCDLDCFYKEHEARRQGGGYPDHNVPALPELLLQRYEEDAPEHCHCVIDARNKGELGAAAARSDAHSWGKVCMCGLLLRCCPALLDLRHGLW